MPQSFLFLHVVFTKAHLHPKYNRDYYFATFTKSNNVLFFLFCNFRHHPKTEGETNFALCRNRDTSHMRIKLMQEDFLVSNGMGFDLNQNVALEGYYIFILRETEN